MNKRVVLILGVCLAGAAANGRPGVAAQKAPPSRAEPAGACRLIPAAAIREAQGAKLIATRPSRVEHGGFVMSRCYFKAEPAVKSISLEVTRASAAAPGYALQARWTRAFSGKKKAEEEGEEALRHAMPVAGLGKAAYWIGKGPVGALYVLGNHAYLRLSLGGSASRKEKVASARGLLQIALRRLQQTKTASR
ncbi:MAG TPA: hypothetical protein VFH85_09595 [Gammaproteobacteria bacterium]|nr:hypothetical protein [Gammaproteobacteria bacterium]